MKEDPTTEQWLTFYKVKRANTEAELNKTTGIFKYKKRKKLIKLLRYIDEQITKHSCDLPVDELGGYSLNEVFSDSDE